jgi:hypothetical protein
VVAHSGVLTLGTLGGPSRRPLIKICLTHASGTLTLANLVPLLVHTKRLHEVAVHHSTACTLGCRVESRHRREGKTSPLYAMLIRNLICHRNAIGSCGLCPNTRTTCICFPANSHTHLQTDTRPMSAVVVSPIVHLRLALWSRRLSAHSFPFLYCTSGNWEDSDPQRSRPLPILPLPPIQAMIISAHHICNGLG